MMNLRLGDTYNLDLDGHSVKLEITSLGTRQVTFQISGDGVKDPERLRRLPTVVFARWLEEVKVRE